MLDDAPRCLLGIRVGMEVAGNAVAPDGLASAGRVRGGRPGGWAGELRRSAGGGHPVG